MKDLFLFLGKNPEVLSALAALLAFTVAFASMLVGAYALFSQRRHNRLSVKPLLSVLFLDYKNKIEISLRNDGFGPLVLNSFKVLNIESGLEKSNIVDHINAIEMESYDHFSGNIGGRAIKSGGCISLLRLEGRIEDSQFHEFRDEVRKILRNLIVIAGYSDVYGKKYSIEAREFEFFGRHFYSEGLEAGPHTN